MQFEGMHYNVFLSSTCQKVHVTVSEHLTVVNCIDSFCFLGMKSASVHPLASQKTVPISFPANGTVVVVVVVVLLQKCSKIPFNALFWGKNGGTSFHHQS
jgi:hypothetical protein